MFSLCEMWTDSVSLGGCVDVPFPFLKPSTCSSRSRSLATSHLMLSISFRQWASFGPHSSFSNFSQSSVGDLGWREPIFLPGTCMKNVWTYNLYDELALRGVTYGHNSCMMDETRILILAQTLQWKFSEWRSLCHPQVLSSNALRRVCSNANNDSTYNLRTSSIHYVNMGRFSTSSQQGLISA
jgi:hypothetical protein